MNQAFVGTSFPPDNENRNIEEAHLLHHLEPLRTTGSLHRAGCESWSCAWSGDNAYFAWSCGNSIVKLIPWNRHKNRTLAQYSSDEDLDRQLNETQEVTIDAGQLVWAVAFGSQVPHTRRRSTNLNWSRKIDDTILATGLQSGCIRTWDAKSGQPLHDLSDHTDVVRDLQFAPDGSMQLVSASRDGTLRVWRLDRNKGGKQHTSRILHGTESKWLYACCWSPNAHTLVAVGKNGSVTLWDMTSNKVLRHLNGHKLDVCGCDFSPDGALLATSSYDASVIVWDSYNGNMLLRLSHRAIPAPPTDGNDSYVRGVSFSHDGRHIASVSDDGYVRFWDIYCPQFPCQTATVINALCCRYSSDGSVLSVGTRNGGVTLWLAPMQVPSMQHICRLAIRRILPTDSIDRLNLPERLKRFLRYEVHW